MLTSEVTICVVGLVLIIIESSLSVHRVQIAIINVATNFMTANLNPFPVTVTPVSLNG